ncbi:MAG TPA: ZIP family metal transporter, partial [Gemmatimonadaceae bacterium]|nr:ZIP family metal transporter [Gemmatimonadaceae bacterium]
MSGTASVWGASLVAVFVASAIPLLATWFLATRRELTAQLVPRLILIAAGALLGAAAFHLIPESLARVSARQVWMLTGAGVVALALLERTIHALERPGANGAAGRHETLGHRSHLMPLGIVSDALHNTIDGALVATAFLTNPSLGVFAGAAIALHELPRELGTFALCIDGGMTPRKAILVNAATGVLALLGAVVALLIGIDARRFGELLLPFAAGNFLYLAGAILVSQRRERQGGTVPSRLALVL